MLLLPGVKTLFLCGLLLATDWGAPPLSAQDNLVLTPPLKEDAHTWLARSDGKPVRLHNNPAATDPTLEELIAFLQEDKTNELLYVDGEFVCTEFALTLHDHAESAGLRAGYVTLTFDEGIGHALNAFETTDFGLVYVDCTGSRDGRNTEYYKSFAYIEKGRPYGTLPLNLGRRDPVSYAYYEQVMAVSGGLMQWRERLDRAAVDLQAASLDLAQRRQHLNLRSASQVAQYNQLVLENNRRGALFNADAQEYNRARRQLPVKPGANRTPVVTLRVWW